MYSQNDEEKHILKYFKERKGRFLDIGAYDGKTFSNVRALYELGWTGVMVEPSPSIFSALMENYPNGDVDLVNAAVGSEPGLRTFYASNDAVSTLSEAHREVWKNAATFRKIIVNLVSVVQLLETFPGPYEFINLDVEGTNWEILQRIPVAALGCELFCVEFGSDGPAIKKFMLDNNMSLGYTSSENYLFVRRP